MRAKNVWIIIDFFRTNSYDLEYFECRYQKLTYGVQFPLSFHHWIRIYHQKAKQIKDFEIPYYSLNSIECSYADYLIWLTLNSDIPCFWKAHLALAWTSLLGIFFPEALHLVLHFHRSASTTTFISCNSQWLNCTF